MLGFRLDTPATQFIPFLLNEGFNFRLSNGIEERIHAAIHIRKSKSEVVVCREISRNGAVITSNVSENTYRDCMWQSARQEHCSNYDACCAYPLVLEESSYHGVIVVVYERNSC